MKRFGLGFVLATAIAACGGDGGSGGSGSGGSGSGGTGSGGNGSGGNGSGGSLTTGQCRTTADCLASGDSCVPPDFDVGCGACQEPMMDELCTDDAACKAQDPTFLCEPVECPCSGIAKTCVPGCTSNTMCADHLECDAANRCSPKTCSGDGDCPDNYACNDGACARASCGSDADCSGYCVGGSCYPGPGWCWDGSAPP